MRREGQSTTGQRPAAAAKKKHKAARDRSGPGKAASRKRSSATPAPASPVVSVDVASIKPAHELAGRASKAHAEPSEQHRLQQALRAMEAFRDDAHSNRQRLRQSLETLEASRDIYAELFDYAPIGYLTLDPNGVIENANHTSASMLKHDRGRLVGMPFINMVAPKDRPAFLEHRSRAVTGRSVTTELSLRGADGREFPVQLSTRESLLPGGGRRRCFLATVIDLTAMRRNEAERLRLATEEQKARLAVEAKDRFLAILSHELRTPLTPVLAAVSDPALQSDLPAHLREVLEMIRRNIAIETQLVEDLLDVSRVTQGKLQLQKLAVDLHQIIRETVELLEPEAVANGIELLRDLRAERHWVSGDAIRLRQVIWNLLRNAIKFTPQGGRILVRAINPGGGLEITVSVRDSGIGIEPARLETLFGPFEQVTPSVGGGLGLGLTICRGLVQAHNGKIIAHSEGPDRGSTFEVTLTTIPAPAEAPADPAANVASNGQQRAAAARAAAPAVSAPAPSAQSSASATSNKPSSSLAGDAAPPPAKNGTSRKSLRIMLVEDHPDTALVMARLLKRQGHHVEVANSFHDAVALSTHAFDLAISDISLPDGSGLDLMRRVRETSQRTRGIALSGLASEADVRRAHDAGFDEHLAKPINFETLLSVIDTLA